VQLTQSHDHGHEVEVQLAHYTLLHHRVNMDVAHTLGGIALDLRDSLSLFDVCHCERLYNRIEGMGWVGNICERKVVW